MGEPELKRMTAEEFLVWQQDQDRNYELVDGFPAMPLKAVVGVTRPHDRITVNVLSHLATQLRRKGWRPATQNIGIKIPAGNIRRSEVMVDCCAEDLEDMFAVEPKLVVEVMSPSTIDFDRLRKVDEYKSLPSLAYILLVDTETSRLTLHVRRGTVWDTELHDTLEAVVELPEIECRLASIDIFEGLPFAEAGSGVRGD